MENVNVQKIRQRVVDFITKPENEEKTRRALSSIGMPILDQLLFLELHGILGRPKVPIAMLSGLEGIDYEEIVEIDEIALALLNLALIPELSQGRSTPGLVS